MRRIMIALVVLAACSDEDPTYGDPSAIKGKRVPGVVETDFFRGGYDPANPSPPATDPSQFHAQSVPTLPVLSPDTPCLTCHVAGGRATAAAAAGYVVAKGGTAPAPLADVVVISNGARFEGKTGKDGFFWIAAGPTPPAPGGRVAVRDSQGRTAEMKQTLPNGGCSSGGCHGPTQTAGLVVVPE